MPQNIHGVDFQFLSTLSLRRATLRPCFSRSFLSNFYPRSPCGERLRLAGAAPAPDKFLSTLSLRRATLHRYCHAAGGGISIHALLAESDTVKDPTARSNAQFLSTLSLRRATPRLVSHGVRITISIHALLAESDWGCRYRRCRTESNFYPRSPCGERRE